MTLSQKLSATLGQIKRCTRCKGTGQARFNHLNGDTHCYLCDGEGTRRVYSKVEKAQIDAARQAEGDYYAKALRDNTHERIRLSRALRAETGDGTISHSSPVIGRAMMWVEAAALRGKRMGEVD
jgi:hypothetical protein